jgi:hypothetical protein
MEKVTKSTNQEEFDKNFEEFLVENCANLIINEKITSRDLYLKITERVKEYVKYLPSVYVLYNTCYGGFHFNLEFIDFCKKNYYNIDEFNPPRTGKILEYLKLFAEEISIKKNEKINKEDLLEYGAENASDKNFSDIKVAKIPPKLDWYIQEYDGMEDVRIV